MLKPRDNLAVYNVPFTIRALGLLNVIADSPEAAIKAAQDSDLADYIEFEDGLRLDDMRGYFKEFGDINTEQNPAVVKIDEDYPITDHPDYDPDEHDEQTPEDEAETKGPLKS